MIGLTGKSLKPMKKRVNLKNRVSALVMSFFLASGLIAPTFSFEAKAEALPNVLETSATIADCVMTYYAMSGSTVTNVGWINTLYDSLGSSFGTLGEFAESGLMTYVDGVWQSTETLTQNIQNSSAYTSLGLDNVFNVSAEQAANGGGIAAATGASTLSGAAACVASNGILPVLGGVTASYWGGIALGTLIANKLDLYGKVIGSGLGIDTSPTKLDMIPDGSSIVIFDYNTGSGKQQQIYCGPIAFAYYYSSGGYNYISYGIHNNTGKSVVGKSIYTNRKGQVTTSNISLNNNNGLVSDARLDSYTSYSVHAPNIFQSSADYNEALAGWNNHTVTPTFNNPSPDQIGDNGNLSGGYDSDDQKYTVPDMKPSIDPSTEAGKPLSLEDWLAFANQANGNTANNNYPDNGNVFDNIIDALKTIVPTPDPGPSPGGETYPVPGPVPTPTPVPDPEYQPETKPQPQYTEKPTENETDITEGDPWTTPDLLDKFPFCIPRDVYRVFTKLDSGARAAPHIQWRFNPNNKIDYTFDIDFSEWDSVATLLRTLELLGFIVALAVATRKMILS